MLSGGADLPPYLPELLEKVQGVLVCFLQTHSSVSTCTSDQQNVHCVQGSRDGGLIRQTSNKPCGADCGCMCWHASVYRTSDYTKYNHKPIFAVDGGDNSEQLAFLGTVSVPSTSKSAMVLWLPFSAATILQSASNAVKSDAGKWEGVVLAQTSLGRLEILGAYIGQWLSAVICNCTF